MKIAEIKNKDGAELEVMIRELSVKLGKLTFERQSKTLKKSSEIGMIKRDIARAKTVLKERLAAAKQ